MQRHTAFLLESLTDRIVSRKPFPAPTSSQLPAKMHTDVVRKMCDRNQYTELKCCECFYISYNIGHMMPPLGAPTQIKVMQGLWYFWGSWSFLSERSKSFFHTTVNFWMFTSRSPSGWSRSFFRDIHVTVSFWMLTSRSRSHFLWSDTWHDSRPPDDHLALSFLSILDALWNLHNTVCFWMLTSHSPSQCSHRLLSVDITFIDSVLTSGPDRRVLSKFCQSSTSQPASEC